MITPLRIGSMILWDYTYRAATHEPFLCWGDHGWFCMIKFESL